MNHDENILSVGDIIIKKNNSTFGSSKSEFETPLLIINSCKSNGKIYTINKKFRIHLEDVIKISNTEKDKILKEWDSFGISPSVEHENRDPCIREDNKSPKLSISPSRVKSMLFLFRRKYKNDAFEIYKCPKCGNLHIGKNKMFSLIK